MNPRFESSVPAPTRVLVVEDNIDDSDLLVRQLEKNNFSGGVRIIPDGAQAWSLLCTEELHSGLIAIFLDLNLPSMHGIKLLRRIKTRTELCNVPIFIMTSSISPKELEACTSLGINGYIAKPVTYLAFANTVANLFHKPRLDYARVE